MTKHKPHSKKRAPRLKPSHVISLGSIVGVFVGAAIIVIYLVLRTLVPSHTHTTPSQEKTLVISFSQKTSRTPLAKRSVVFSSNNGADCISSPVVGCTDNRQLWRGATDESGRVVVPSSPYVQVNNIFSIEKEDGTWTTFTYALHGLVSEDSDIAVSAVEVY